MKDNGEDMHEYVRICRALGCNADSSLLVSLETDWEHLRVSNDFSLLPLLELVRQEEDHVKGTTAKTRSAMLKYRSARPWLSKTLKSLKVKRSVSRSHLADSNGRVLAELLRTCGNLEELDISSVGLSSKGAMEFATALSYCKKLKVLNISFNSSFGTKAVNCQLEESLKKMETLETLNITNNKLGFYQVQRLKNAMLESHSKKKGSFKVLDKGNNVFEELLNVLTHGIGLIFAIVGSFVLMHHASAEGQTRRAFYSSLAYCFCLVLLFASSTALHAVFLSETASIVLGLMDHTAIYFLIAGTYLPFCLISLEKHPNGIYFAVLQWCLALVGIVLCFVAERVVIPFKVPIELALYLSMGWMLVFAWEDVERHIHPNAIYLLGCGGLAYSGGVAFFIMEKIHHPVGHVLWHIFVLVGATCHYFAILLYVVGLEEEIASAFPNASSLLNA